MAIASIMSHVRRAIAIFLPAVSVTLLLATLVMWVRSHWVADCVAWGTGTRFAIAVCDRGGLVAGRITFLFDDQDTLRAVFRWPVDHRRTHRPPVGYLAPFDQVRPAPPRFLGFSAEFGQDVHPSDTILHHHVSAVAVPLWFPALIFAVAPVWLLVDIRKRRSGEARCCLGLCPACGYDLRATPGRCPECGGVADHERALTASL